MVAYADDQPKKKWDADLNARATNRVLFYYENHILMVIHEYFESCSIPCDVLIHDGAMIRKKDLPLSALKEHLTRCEKAILKSGITGIRLSEKKMDEHLSLDGLTAPMFVDDRDRFMAIGRVLAKNRNRADKEFYAHHKQKMGRENIQNLMALDDDWIIRDSDDLAVVRKQIDDDLTKGNVVCIRAGMGVGKTHSLISYIKRTRAPYITILSARIAFAESIKTRYEEETGLKWVVYNDHTNTSRFDAENLVVQAESLHYLGEREGGLLIIDECEAFFTQMTSFDTHKYHRQNVKKFDELLKTSKKIICMDAFLSNKTIRVLDSFGLPSHKYNYTIKLKPRIAQNVGTLPILVDHLIDDVKSGKKVYFVCSSLKRWRDEIRPSLLEHLPTKTILEYNGKHKSTPYSEIQQAWVGADVVCATTSITVGVDFSIEHFDVVYIFASSASCNLVRDLFQSHYRVRKISEKKLIFALDPNTRGKGPEFPRSPHLILKKLHSQEGAITRLYAQNFTSTPKWLTALAVSNMTEHSLSVMDLEALFKYYLGECNYTLADAPEEVKAWDIIEPPPMESFMELLDIPNYEKNCSVHKKKRCDCVTITSLNKRKNGGGNLTVVEQWGQQKYWFKTHIDTIEEILHVEYNALFNKFEIRLTDITKIILEYLPPEFGDKRLWCYYLKNPKHFKNLHYELKSLDKENLNQFVWHHKKFAQAHVGVLQHHYIREIKTKLELVHTQDFGSIIKRANITKIIEWLNSSGINPVTKKHEAVSATLNYLFETRRRGKNKKEDLNVQSGIGFINQILNKWGGTKLKQGKLVQPRIKGKKKRENKSDYILNQTKPLEISKINIWWSLIPPCPECHSTDSFYCLTCHDVIPPEPTNPPRKKIVRPKRWSRGVCECVWCLNMP